MSPDVLAPSVKSSNGTALVRRASAKGGLRPLHPGEETGIPALEFQLPVELEAGEPPEARGLERDQVRLMVTSLHDGRTLHTRFRQLPDLLEAGDVVVINTSGTRNAALHARLDDGRRLHLYLSTRLPDCLWVVELRQPEAGGATVPYLDASPEDRLSLPAGGRARLLSPYPPRPAGQVRLWLARLRLPEPLEGYLKTYGFPIRYRHVPAAWPASYYQTVYAREAGSAEMPSAGRAFTPEVITCLVAGGVLVVPLTLHTGVSSVEADEPPYEEYYNLPEASAWAVNAAREHGGRVIAVGTTVVRALESAADPGGSVHPQEGWTDLVVTPERGLRVVDGLLTGFHEPASSHLSILSALMDFETLKEAYQEALEEGYLWHEFGDLHLILP